MPVSTRAGGGKWPARRHGGGLRWASWRPTVVVAMTPYFVHGWSLDVVRHVVTVVCKAGGRHPLREQRLSRCEQAEGWVNPKPPSANRQRCRPAPTLTSLPRRPPPSPACSPTSSAAKTAAAGCGRPQRLHRLDLDLAPRFHRCPGPCRMSHIQRKGAKTGTRDARRVKREAATQRYTRAWQCFNWVSMLARCRNRRSSEAWKNAQMQWRSIRYALYGNEPMGQSAALNSPERSVAGRRWPRLEEQGF